MSKADRGFASMDWVRQREIASMGGKTAHQKGTAHEWDSEEARQAGRKGGLATARVRTHARASVKGGVVVEQTTPELSPESAA